MQLLLEVSEEFGETEGLGLIPGRVISVPTHTLSGIRQKIPHIGWSALQLAQASTDWRNTLMQNNRVGEAAYFLHSFMAVPTDPTHRIANCSYGSHLITAVIGRDQITGCQFHPEKSGEVGLKILRRFCFD
jgi:glutamine amidotransferase